jgi:hypothetical protein
MLLLGMLCSEYSHTKRAVADVPSAKHVDHQQEETGIDITMVQR